MLVCCLVALTLACCGCRSSRERRHGLGLEFSVDGSEYRIKWDPNSPAVASAARAVLTIDDGGSRREFHLDRNQLRSASIVYSAVTDRLIFQLAVYPPPAIEMIATRDELLSPSAAPATSSGQIKDTAVPETRTAQEQSAGTSGGGSGFAVQLGIFESRASAEQYEGVVKRERLPSEVRLDERIARWKLIAGCVPTAAGAESLAVRLRQRFPGAVVVRGCQLP